MSIDQYDAFLSDVQTHAVDIVFGSPDADALLQGLDRKARNDAKALEVLALEMVSTLRLIQTCLQQEPPEYQGALETLGVFVDETKVKLRQAIRKHKKGIRATSAVPESATEKSETIRAPKTNRPEENPEVSSPAAHPRITAVRKKIGEELVRKLKLDDDIFLQRVVDFAEESGWFKRNGELLPSKCGLAIVALCLRKGEDKPVNGASLLRLGISEPAVKREIRDLERMYSASPRKISGNLENGVMLNAAKMKTESRSIEPVSNDVTPPPTHWAVL